MLAKKQQGELWLTLCKTISEQTGVSKSKVTLITKAYQYQQIRKMESMDAQAKLLIEIPLVAKEYGARIAIPRNVLAEAVRLVMKKFPHLGIAEIREAYREFTAGMLDVQGAETYGGEFNVSQLGKILAAYSENRANVVAEYIRQRDQILFDIQEEEKKKALEAKFEKEFPSLIMSKRKEFEDWRDVPEWWYKAIKKRGWISFDHGEANEIFEDAKDLAVLEQEKIKKERSLNMSLRLTRSIPELEELSKTIARKLTIFRKVVKNPSWNFE